MIKEVSDPSECVAQDKGVNTPNCEYGLVLCQRTGYRFGKAREFVDLCFVDDSGVVPKTRVDECEVR